MLKFIGTLAFLFTLLLSATSAKAAVTDCSTGCDIGLKDDGTHFYNKTTGAEEGVIGSIGTGNGAVSTGDDGYSFVTRQGNPNLWITDAKTGGTCFNPLSTGMTSSLKFGNDVYTLVPGGDGVLKSQTNCTGGVAITVGDGPGGIATDGTTIYVLNTNEGTISTIVPPAETAAMTYGIGRSGLDFLSDIEYNASNNKLYVTGLAGIYEVDLPLTLGTSVLWQALPNGIGKLSQNDNYFAVNDTSNGVAYLIEKASPSIYDSIPCNSCRSADLSDDTLFTTGGFAPDVGIRAWDLTGTELPFSPITTTNTWSSAYLAPFTPLATCQNGVREGTEECDQSDFGTSTCGTEGFDGGSLTCSASCTIVNTSCTYNCGNNVRAGTEECDGTDLDSQSCTTLGMGFIGGTLACNPGSCTFDTSSCTSPVVCGDGNVDPGEECDGANLDGEDCQSQGYLGGTLSCHGGCGFDYSGCNNCGNGTLDMNEECDGTDLDGQDCVSQGYSSGTLSCATSCNFDTGSCVLDSCGDGVLDIGEMCDDGNTTSSDGCSNVCQIENGWECSGTPSNCTQICGNGNVDAGEECDGSNLNNATCGDFGGEGDLVCKSDCTLDTSACLVCNDPQLVYDITINDVNQTQLTGHNFDLFSDVIRDLTEADGDRISCGDYEVAGQTVASVVVSLNAEEYKLVRISGNNFVSNCLFFSKTGPAKLYVNITDPKKTRIDNTSTGTGLICVHSGENMQFQIGGLLLGTLGTAFSFQYLTFNPLAEQAGKWAEVYVSNDGVNLIELANPLNNGDLFVANFTDGPLYINIDALDDNDLSVIGRKPVDPPKRGCNCSTIEPSTVTLYSLLLVLFFLLSLRRLRRRSLQRVERKSRNQ